MHITPSRASKSAIEAIEANGGSVFCQYYNSLALRDCIKGRTDRVSAGPTRRNDISAFLVLFSDFTFHIWCPSQFGIPNGETEVTFPQKQRKECPLCRNAGESCRSNFLRSRLRTFRKSLLFTQPSRESHQYITHLLLVPLPSCRARYCEYVNGRMVNVSVSV